MFSKVNSAGILGVKGYLITVEVDVSDGLPGYSMVGYLASEVKEAQDRVRTALKNSGYRLQSKKVTVNLSPADIRKEGTAFDLPIAIAVLSSYGIVNIDSLSDAAIVGELGLDGSIKPIYGTLSIVSAVKERGCRRCFLPKENVREGIVVQGIDIIGVGSIRELVSMVLCPTFIRPVNYNSEEQADESDSYHKDYSDVNGQLLMKRATEISVAGMHNILYIGPAGTGKTMIAQRIPTIMPSLSREENIEISKIYSISGLLSPDKPLLTKRPFRSPHHTISPQALAGGGRIPRPGEISLASGGVLFLDEFPEFHKSTLEILRQPLEEHKIIISRVYGTIEYPAEIMVAAAMNPCCCGFYPDRSRCNCTQAQVKRYLGRISKPLLDRIDICVEALPITYDEMHQQSNNESSYEIRKRIEKARDIQKIRYSDHGILFNSRMNGQEIKEFCGLHKKEEEFLKKVFDNMGLSARAYGKILKVARTIADLSGEDQIKKEHLAEAIGFRCLEKKYWGGLA